MSPKIYCHYHDPVVVSPDGAENWELIPLGSAPGGVKPDFQFSSSTCYTTGTPEAINGFTYGEIFVCFCFLIFGMALIFNFIFTNFIKDR